MIDEIGKIFYDTRTLNSFFFGTGKVYHEMIL